jgi:ribonuclease T1
MLKKYSQLIVGIIIGLIVGLLFAKTIFVNNTTTDVTPSIQHQNKNKDNNRNNNNENTSNTNTTNNSNVPAKVVDVLQYIKNNNRAMDGYLGGRVFSNREKILPQKDSQGNNIDYQEWDVNKKIKGQNRGTERICTGSDGRSWYTNNHYKTFTEIK